MAAVVTRSSEVSLALHTPLFSFFHFFFFLLSLVASSSLFHALKNISMSMLQDLENKKTSTVDTKFIYLVELFVEMNFELRI